MRIPVFVSSPTALNPAQSGARKVVIDMLDRYKMEARALGRTDYPKDFPLREVLIIAKHCHGGIILGFEQLRVTEGVWKSGTKNEKAVDPNKPVQLPTPWNQLEAGILFGLRLPLLIFRESNVYGGVFDVGTTEVFVHGMPPARPTPAKRDELEHVFLKWSAAVQRHYETF
jgi:hypothetical protein